MEKELQKENEELRNELREANETLDALRRGDVDAIVVKGPEGDQLYSLKTTAHPYQVFIENMADAAVIMTHEGMILYANPGFLKMMSCTEDVIGSSMSEFVEEQRWRSFLSKIAQRTDASFEFQFIKKTTGKAFIGLVSISLKSCLTSGNECFLITDISRLKRAQMLSETSESVVKILSEASTFPVAFRLMIEMLHASLGWDVLVIWLWDKEKQSMSCAHIAQIPGINIASFAKVTREMKDATMGMLSNRVFTTHRPTWITDISDDFSFVRREEALESGLKGAFAFPFFEESQLRGVVELFRRTPFTENVDDSLLNLFTSMGIEIGLYMQRKTAEEEKQQLSAIIDHSPNGILSVDRDGIILSWNLGAEEIFGWRSDEIIGRSAKVLFPPQKSGEYEEIKMNLLSGKTVRGTHAQRIRKDGKLIWVEDSYGLIKNSLGELIGVSIITEEITSQKEAMEQLSKSEERFRTFIKITEDWVWELDQEGKFTFSNQAVQTILGFSVEELIGKKILNYIVLEDRERFEPQFESNVKLKKGWIHQTMRFYHKNGEVHWLESNAIEKLDENEKLLGFQGVSQDVTEMKKLEIAKNEFISIINHELRTPLTSIYGALTLLTTKKLDSGNREKLIDTAQRNAERLSKLINDIIDVQKMQFDKFKFDLKPMELRDVVREAVSYSEVIAKRLNTEIKIQEPLPKTLVNGDSLRLLQVMNNILSNALKFSPKGGVIKVYMEELEPNVRVSIEDQGPGVPEEFRSKVFEKFAQADSTAKRGFEGTGLGLNICRSIVHGHGGTIDFKSSEKGSTFFFELPIYYEGKK